MGLFLARLFGGKKLVGGVVDGVELEGPGLGVLLLGEFDGVDFSGGERDIEGDGLTIFGDLKIGHFQLLFIDHGRAVGAVIMVVIVGDFRTKGFGKVDLEAGFGELAGVDRKGGGFAIPLGVLKGGALAADAEPSASDLGGPEATLLIKSELHAAGAGAANEVDTPSLVVAIDLLETAAEVV